MFVKFDILWFHQSNLPSSHQNVSWVHCMGNWSRRLYVLRTEDFGCVCTKYITQNAGHASLIQNETLRINEKTHNNNHCLYSFQASYIQNRNDSLEQIVVHLLSTLHLISTRYVIRMTCDSKLQGNDIERLKHNV